VAGCRHQVGWGIPAVPLVLWLQSQVVALLLDSDSPDLVVPSDFDSWMVGCPLAVFVVVLVAALVAALAVFVVDLVAA